MAHRKAPARAKKTTPEFRNLSRAYYHECLKPTICLYVFDAILFAYFLKSFVFPRSIAHIGATFQVNHAISVTSNARRLSFSAAARCPAGRVIRRPPERPVTGTLPAYAVSLKLKMELR